MRGQLAIPVFLLTVVLLAFAAGQAISTTDDVPAVADDDPEPYVENHQWTGLLGCSARWPTGGVLPYSGINACAVLEPTVPSDFLHEWTVQPGLESVVGAVVWDSSGPSLGDELLIYMEVAGMANSPPRYVVAEGQSVLEFRVDAGYVIETYEWHLHHYDFSNLENPLSVMFRVFPGGDLNVVVMQEFTVYWDLYYGEGAPEDATAVPAA